MHNQLNSSASLRGINDNFVKQKIMARKLYERHLEYPWTRIRQLQHSWSQVVRVVQPYGQYVWPYRISGFCSEWRQAPPSGIDSRR